LFIFRGRSKIVEKASHIALIQPTGANTTASGNPYTAAGSNRPGQTRFPLAWARQWGFDLLEVLYPRLCAGTGVELLPAEEAVSLQCLQNLPHTYYHLAPQANQLQEMLDAKLPIRYAAAAFIYDDQTPIRPLIHQLKYKNRPDIGRALGRYYGAMLLGSPLLEEEPLLVPIPLHRRKQRQRGYNQAAKLAEGIAQTTGLPVRQDLVARVRKTESQARMQADSRWKNVAGSFQAADELPKHPIILVDDVITTGATMLAALRALQKAGAQDLRVLGLAHAAKR
jgi:ComF family protein